MSVRLVSRTKTGEEVWQIRWRPFGKVGVLRFKNYEGTKKDAAGLERAIVQSYARINARKNKE